MLYIIDIRFTISEPILTPFKDINDMQILLTNAEYSTLSERAEKYIKMYKSHLDLLDKYAKLKEYILEKESNIYCNNKSCYCDYCPLGILHLDVCIEPNTNYSK